MIPAAAHRFYADLQQDKEWWRANRSTYQDEVERPLRALLEEGADRFGGQVKLFRPHRDVRFSADKRPLRTDAVGGLGAPDDPAIRYIRIDAQGTTVGAGAPQPARDHLAAFRDRVARDAGAAEELRDILKALAASGFDLPDDPLKRAPRSYQTDHPAIDLLRRRAFAAEQHFEPGRLDDPVGRALVFDAWTRIEPFVKWLDGAADPVQNG